MKDRVVGVTEVVNVAGPDASVPTDEVVDRR
jgi:hypothetical protein